MIELQADRLARGSVRYSLKNSKEWEESEHPRAADGKFGSGGSKSSEESKSKDKQIESPQFKQWFGDSKVIDDSGKPLVMYHGASLKFDEFDPEHTHGMIWLSGNKEYSDSFAGDKGNVLQTYAKIENPLDVSEFTEEKGLDEWESILSDMGIDISGLDRDEMDWAPQYGLYTFFDLLPHAGNNYIDTGVLDKIKEAGYDGIKAPEEETDGIKSGETYVAFDSKQIKSATDNSGDFNPESNKITNSIKVYHASP